MHVALIQVAVAVASTLDRIWTAPLGWRPSTEAQQQLVCLYSGATTFRAWPLTPTLTRGSGAQTAVGEFIAADQISYLTSDGLPVA